MSCILHRGRVCGMKEECLVLCMKKSVLFSGRVCGMKEGVLYLWYEGRMSCMVEEFMV